VRKTADAVIIGGGIVGASTLYHLTELGFKHPVLLDKGGFASGSTGDSAAIVRQHYSNPVSIRLVLASLHIFQRLQEEKGRGPNVFNATGWLFLCPQNAASMFDENLQQLKDLGVKTWQISVEAALEHLPGLNTDGVGRVAYEPESGYADPHAATEALIERARAKGAEAYENTPATGIKLDRDRVTGVETVAGSVSTPVVVNAAGPWAKKLGEWVGLDLPIEISREQEVLIEPPSGAGPVTRAVSNMVDRFYMRPAKDGRMLMGVGHPKQNEPADPDSYNRKADPEFLRDVSGRLATRFPALADSKITASWAGLYAITPDWSMIVDRAPGIEGMYLAVGGSGHSFKLGPGIGLALAELIAKGASETVDISDLRASRFDEDAMLKSTYGGNRG
jgi:glycine/D-amino acid oxidase-like deaminating enzyme